MVRSIVAALLGAALVAAPAAAAQAPTAAPLQSADVRGARLGYRVLNPDAGGRPLVLVCGYGVTMAEWDPAFVEQLARGRRVVLFDNRGLGNSTGSVSGLTVETMAADAIGLIRRLGLRRADLLGWSMGGYIAQRVAIRAPRLVGRVVLASTDAGSPTAVEPAPSVVRRLTSARSSAALLPLLFPASRQGAGRAWLRAIGRQPDLTAADFRTPAQTIEQQALAAGPRWSARGAGTYGQLGRLKARTLIAFGAEDVVVPPANARILARGIRGSSTVRYRDAGHAFLFQEPRAKARRFSAFLDRR